MSTPYQKSAASINDSSDDDDDSHGNMDTSQALNVSTISENNAGGIGGSGKKEKKRRKTSEVWQYFNLQPISNEKTKEQIAGCKYCGHQIKYISQNGTGGLRAHAIRCGAIRDLSAGLDDVHSEILEESKKLGSITGGSAKKRYYPVGLISEEKKLISNPVINSKVKIATTELILLEGLPFNFSQSDGFKQFSKTLFGEQLDTLPTAEEVESEISLMYSNLFMKLHSILELIYPTNSKVSVVVKLLPTERKHRVVTIGLQYVNADWEFMHFLLNVLYIDENDNGEKIAKDIINELQEYKLLSHVFYAVFDKEASALQIDLYFWQFMKERGLEETFLFDSFELLTSQHTYPVIINAVVKELFAVMQPSIQIIRNTCRTMNLHQENKEVVDFEHNWRSTCDLIHYFVVNKNLFEATLPTSEWKVVEAFDKLLSAICYSLDGLTKSKVVTAHLLLSNICDVNVELDSFLKVCNSNVPVSTEKISSLFRESFEPLLPTFAIGLILDPSCKVEFISETMDSRKAERYAACINHRYKLYQQTTASSNELSTALAMIDPNSFGHRPDVAHDSRESFLKRRKIESSSYVFTDLDLYLKEPLQIVSSAAVLAWWKANAARFPSVANMAKDFLACPVSAFSSNQIFGEGADTLPSTIGTLPFNSMRRAILCKDWIHSLSSNGR